jgi:hypothetical protein
MEFRRVHGYNSPMTELEEQLLRSLMELDEAVKNMPVANPKPNLVALFGTIDGLAARLPAGTHPRLLHFLYKRSYGKALLFLQGRSEEIEKGQCDRSQPPRASNA